MLNKRDSTSNFMIESVEFI